MDPEFINALPEEFRQEVVAQYLRDQRRALQPSAPDNLNAEFLNALPFEIREEVIEFERIENESRQRPARAVDAAAPQATSRLAEPPTRPHAPIVNKKKIIETVQLIDKSGLVALM